MAEMDHTSIDPEQVGPWRPRGLGILASGLVALTALWLSQAGTARAHGNHGGAVGVAGHSGAGISTLEPDEGLAFALDLFGYFSGAIASGWRVGEPLGPGGKLPLYYNQNTIEPLTDQALRPVFVPGDPNTRLVGPSLWEREAVDATIVSPFVELMAGPVFKIRATWSGAWYGQPIHRQRRVGRFHANLTLSAWLIYRFDSDVPGTTAGPPAAPSARAAGH